MMSIGRIHLFCITQRRTLMSLNTLESAKRTVFRNATPCHETKTCRQGKIQPTSLAARDSANRTHQRTRRRIDTKDGSEQLRPKTRWSTSSTPRTSAVSTSRRVKDRSSSLGVGSPVGWLCATITPRAFHRIASRKTSRTWTSVASRVPRVTRNGSDNG